MNLPRRAVVSGIAPLRVQVAPGHAAREEARRQAVEYLARWGACADRATVYAFELVLEEWLTNVFRHGGGTSVTVELECDGQRMRLRFVDDGRAFNPTEAPERVVPQDLDEAEPGGLGLFLIRRYSRNWSYSREAGLNVMQVEIGCPLA